MAEDNINLEIIYEDEHYVIVNKQPGVLSIPDRFRADIPSLFDILKKKYGQIFVVHRLDRETSGVICFARTPQAHAELSMQFEKGQVSKTYLALVCGHFENKEGTINLPIGKDPEEPGLMSVDSEGGKNSLTGYRVLEELGNYSFVEASPRTGRTHQVRVHMNALGHPLAVDRFYGNADKILLSQIKKRYKLGKFREEKPLMDRLTLHALRIRFYHFARKEEVVYGAELPRDFAVLVKQLRKYAKK